VRRTLSDLLAGVLLLGQGLKEYGRHPRRLLLGLIPALLSLILFTTLLAALLYWIEDLSTAVTWFADGWPAGWRRTAEILAGVTLIGVGGLLAVISFTAVTLIIGDPFYEAIARSIEDERGGVPGAVDLPWHRELRRSIIDSLRLLLLSACIAVPLAIAGFIPIAGQTVVPVLGALVGGWFLALELVSFAFNRRGMRLVERRRVLRRHRALAIGFGAAVFCCFLIPFGAVLVMPAAVAGGTLLARRVLDERVSEPA
jgi:CysZ protein